MVIKCLLGRGGEARCFVYRFPLLDAASEILFPVYPTDASIKIFIPSGH